MYSVHITVVTGADNIAERSVAMSLVSGFAGESEARGFAELHMDNMKQLNLSSAYTVIGGLRRTNCLTASEGHV